MATSPRPDPDQDTPGIDSAEYHRRRRGRNLALLAALVAFVALVYAITLVKLKGG